MCVLQSLVFCCFVNRMLLCFADSVCLFFRQLPGGRGGVSTEEAGQPRTPVSAATDARPASALRARVQRGGGEKRRTYPF